MRYETIRLSVPGAREPVELVAYAPDNFPTLGAERRRPAIILCPGGAYRMVAEGEGEPVALRFAGLGCAVFLLRYHAGTPWPVPQRQLLAAVDYVRSGCEVYHVDPAAVLVMGFSAGGHLAACAGTMWSRPELYRPLKKRAAAFRPDGMILCYPVVSSGPAGHRPSFENLLGERYEELAEAVSIERCVRAATPPVFLWHTADDTTVPVENALLLREALEARGVPVECHIFPHGSHGQSLADPACFPPERAWRLSVPCGAWVEWCRAWIRRNYGG